MAGLQNWRVHLDYALVLGSRLSPIRPAAPLSATFQLLLTGAFFVDNPSRQKSQCHCLVNRSFSRVCRTKIEQRVIGHWLRHDGLDYLSPAQKKNSFSFFSHSESRSVNGPLAKFRKNLYKVGCLHFLNKYNVIPSPNRNMGLGEGNQLQMQF